MLVHHALAIHQYIIHRGISTSDAFIQTVLDVLPYTLHLCTCQAAFVHVPIHMVLALAQDCEYYTR